MPGTIGRKIALTWGGAAVQGVRQKNISVAGAPIDVSADEDDGWRTLLEEAGQNEVGVSLSGVTKSRALMSDWFNGTRTKTLVLTYPDGATLSGTFFLASYKDNGPYQDAVTFDADLVSTGPITFST